MYTQVQKYETKLVQFYSIFHQALHAHMKVSLL